MLTFTLDIDFAHSSVLREIGNIRLILDSLAQKFEEELRKEDEDERLLLKESKKHVKGRKVINKNFGLLELPEDNDDEIPFVGETKKKTKKKKVTIKEEDKEDEDEDEIEEVNIRDIIKEEKEENITPHPVVRDTRFVPDGSVICECGVQYVSKNKCRHIKSKHHIEAMKFKNINC